MNLGFLIPPTALALVLLALASRPSRTSPRRRPTAAPHTDGRINPTSHR
jgi:hypothetical protein